MGTRFGAVFGDLNGIYTSVSPALRIAFNDKIALNVGIYLNIYGDIIDDCYWPGDGGADLGFRIAFEW